MAATQCPQLMALHQPLSHPGQAHPTLPVPSLATAMQASCCCGMAAPRAPALHEIGTTHLISCARCGATSLHGVLAQRAACPDGQPLVQAGAVEAVRARHGSEPVADAEPGDQDNATHSGPPVGLEGLPEIQCKNHMVRASSVTRH